MFLIFLPVVLPVRQLPPACLFFCPVRGLPAVDFFLPVAAWALHFLPVAVVTPAISIWIASCIVLGSAEPRSCGGRGEKCMNNAMFSGLFGALTNEHRMNAIANNLANVNTTGYKRDTLAFKDTFAYYAHDIIREPLANCRSTPLFPEMNTTSRTRIAVSETDFSQGSMQHTGDPLDFAITGDNAFFKVTTPNGEYLTRSGHFIMTSEGRLVTPQGYTVQGMAGDIVIPQGTRNVSVSEDGQILADGAAINTFVMVAVDKPNNLEKVGHNLFTPREKTNVQETDAYASGGRIQQGFLEKANVEVVSEMVNMIETQRQFEAYQKTMQSADALDRQAITQVGKKV